MCRVEDHSHISGIFLLSVLLTFIAHLILLIHMTHLIHLIHLVLILEKCPLCYKVIFLAMATLDTWLCVE